MKRTWEKLLPLLLTMAMLLQLMPTFAFAEGEGAEELLPYAAAYDPDNAKTEPEVSDEVVGRRQANIKHFQLSDGSWVAATYPEAVHFEQDGEWVEIDNRLELKEVEFLAPVTIEGKTREATDLNWQEEAQTPFAEELPLVSEAEPTEEAATAEETLEKLEERPEFDEAELDSLGNMEPGGAGNERLDGDAAPAPDPGRDLEKVVEDAFVNSCNRFGVVLPVALTETSWIGVSDQGYSMYFRLVGTEYSEAVLTEEQSEPETALAKAAQVYVNSEVIYPDALPGAELRYDVRGQSLKETVTFPDLGIVPEQLCYEIWAENMTAEVMDEGTILFYADGEPVFELPAPFLMDSEGSCDGTLVVELEDHGEGRFILRYTPEREWLEAGDRSWPVMLDPVITNVVNTNYIRDSFIRQGYPSYGGGGFYYFYAGFYSNATKAARGLIKHTQIPSLGSGDVVVKAQLTAYGRVYQSNGTQIQVDAHAITGSWDSQTVKWNNQPAHEDEILDFQIVNSTAGKTYTWDVTKAVQRWYGGNSSEGGTLPNQGFMLISPTENNWNVLLAQFNSSESSPATYWPMLYIYYTNTTGLESYWDYTSAGAGRAGTVYANNYTGNMVVNRSDMGYSGNRMPVSIAFTYNQNDCTMDIGYGKGWRSAYSQLVEKVTLNTGTYYRWTDADGTRLYFHHSGGVWKDENGQGYTLTVGATGYTISDRDNNSLSFDANGRLISMSDRLGNSLSVSYTESGTSNLRISKVIDGAGRVYQFSYSNNLLSSVSFQGTGSTPIETVSYTYSSGSLSAITYADGKSAGYSYTNNTLTEARDIQRSDGTSSKLNITYGGSPARVTGIAYYDAGTMVNSVSLLYGNHYTKVTDNVGRWCGYEFNNYGNTVSVYNQAGQALYGSYATDTNSSGRANQLTHSSRLQDTVTNLLATRVKTRAWSETVSVQSGAAYSLSGVGAAGSTLSMTAGSETQTATAVSSTERNEVTITVPSGVTSLTISGSGAYSELQLEQTEAASRYNLLSNTDMSSVSGWTGVNTGDGDGIVTETGSRAKLNRSALALTGVGTSAKQYTQTISVNGSLGDDYSFGGWVKSGSVPLDNINDPDSALKRRCGIEVRLLNGSMVVAEKYVPANAACQEWQFLSGSVRASGNYNSIEFSLVYDYNENISYFDGAQLFREKFAYVYSYDSEGRLEKITDLEGRETTYTYRGTTSDITSITLPGGAQYSYSYSNNGLLQSAVSDTGVTSSYSYDAYGNPTGTSITGGNEKSLTSSMTYTSDGNMAASVTGNDAETVTYTNDTDRSLVLSVTDPAGTVTTNSYDTMRRPVSSQTGNSSITNTYSDDLLTGLSHSNTANSSTRYTLGYTTADLLYSVQVGSAYTLVQNSYNAGTWTLARQDYGNGAGWAYSYNEFDQVTSRWTTNGTTGVEFQYFYNSEGALARVEQYETTLSSGSITGRTLVNTERYYYDTGDRLIRVWETDGNGNQHEFRWTYDSNDQVTELVETVNGRAFTYANSYNGDQQPTQSSYEDVLKSFTYDGLGRLSQSAVTRGGNAVLTTDYTFRDLDAARTTTQVSALQNSFGNQSESFTYTYDVTGNILSVNGDTGTVDYKYDALNELTWEYNEPEGKAWNYTYDLGGNILSKTEYEYQAGAVGELLAAVDYAYDDADWPDLLTAYDGEPIDYDGIGNPLYYRGWSFAWQGGRQLATASDGGTDLSFVYNESGLRTEKTVNGGEVHRYVYRGSTLVAEITDDYALYFHHDANGGIVGFTYVSGNTQTEYFYRKNLQGDIIGIVNASGNSVAEYRYDAWGRILSATGTMASINPIRYRGYYYDAETGLYYLQSRYYDPTVGRFINADGYVSTGQGVVGCNMFAYCGNEPVDMIDSDGLFPVFPPEWVEEVGEIVETIIGALYYVTTYTRRGELYEHWVYPSGDPAHSRHYSDHGNQKTHPLVPHDHDWHDDGNGNMREDKESQPVNPGFAAPGSKKSNTDTALKITGGIAVGLIFYEGGKWLIAVLTAAPTGGGSLAVAALVP